MYHAHFFRVALLFAAFAVAGCNPRVDTPQVGVYRAVLRLPGGDTPFGFEVAQEQQQYVLYLTNDTERTRVSNVKVADGELTAIFPGYENSLRATMHRDRIEGSVTLIKAGGKEQVIPFTAKLGESIASIGMQRGTTRTSAGRGKRPSPTTRARRRERSTC